MFFYAVLGWSSLNIIPSVHVWWISCWRRNAMEITISMVLEVLQRIWWSSPHLCWTVRHIIVHPHNVSWRWRKRPTIPSIHGSILSVRDIPPGAIYHQHFWESCPYFDLRFSKTIWKPLSNLIGYTQNTLKTNLNTTCNSKWVPLNMTSTCQFLAKSIWGIASHRVCFLHAFLRSFTMARKHFGTWTRNGQNNCTHCITMVFRWGVKIIHWPGCKGWKCSTQSAWTC